MIDEYLGKKIEIQCCFRFFSKSVFSQKSSESPRFSDMLRPIQPKFFSQILDTLLGGIFRFEKYCSGDFTKFVLVEK